MKRINLKNYGFIEAPELNFTDDGNRFICYRMHSTPKGMYLSKCTSKGYVYISIRLDNTIIPWEVIKNAPFYNDLELLNGVKPEELKDEDMSRFVDTWVTCEKFVEDYLKNGPTPEQKKAIEAAEAQRIISSYKYQSDATCWTSWAAKIAENKRTIEGLLAKNAEMEANLLELKQKAEAAKAVIKAS